MSQFVNEQQQTNPVQHQKTSQMTNKQRNTSPLPSTHSQTALAVLLENKETSLDASQCKNNNNNNKPIL